MTPDAAVSPDADRMQREFRALELFCILYDVAIDQEEFNPDWLHVAITVGGVRKGEDDAYPCELHKHEMPKTRRPWRRHFYYVPDLPQVPFSVDTTCVGSAIPFFPGGCQIPESWASDCRLALTRTNGVSGVCADYWRHLLLAKRSRALLQRRGTTEAFDALDDLGLSLVKAMPSPPRRLDSDADHALFLMHVLFRNEASACMHGFHSIGHADDCMTLIRRRLDQLGGKKPGQGWTPYELVALFNKAQGNFHIREHEQALAVFEDIARNLSLFDDQKPQLRADEQHYFGSVPWFGWPGQEQLFRLYLGVPSVIQATEILINLQRSIDARSMLDSCATAFQSTCRYQEHRIEILNQRIDNDTFDARSAKEPLPSPNWSSSNVGVAPNHIRLQREAVRAERSLTVCDFTLLQIYSDRQWDATGAGASGAHRRASLVRKLVDTLEETKTSLDCRLQMAMYDRSETDQAVLAWSKTLDFLPGVVRLVISLLRDADEKEAIELANACRHLLALEMPDEMTWTSGRESNQDALSVQDLARDLCIDPERRDHLVETRRLLLKSASRLTDGVAVCRGLDMRSEDCKDAIDWLVRTTSDFAHGMLSEETLVAMEEAPGVVPNHVRHDWHESSLLLNQRAGDPPALPLCADGSGGAAEAEELHADLRRFICREFLQPTGVDWRRDLTTEQRASVENVLWDCAECCDSGQADCFDGGRPKKGCARAIVNASSAFFPTRSAEQTGSGACRHYYDRVLEANQRQIAERLYDQRAHDVPSRWGFAVLQRWNSFTPAMAASDGGGYFLFHTDGDRDASKPHQVDLGVVIDPGYGFLKNFLSQGFGIRDVSAILVTHDHPDHLADFEAIVSLLIEARKNRTKGTHVPGPLVDAVLSQGAFQRLKPVVESARQVFRNTYVLDPSGGVLPSVEFPTPDSSTLTLVPTHALHKDASTGIGGMGCDSVGVRAQVQSNGECVRIGIPSDTKWRGDIAAQYTGEDACGLVCAHIDNFAPEEFPLVDYFDTAKTMRKVLHEKWQLYLPGVFWLVRAIARSPRGEGRSVLVVLSEFGEEMSRGLRVDLARRLNEYAEIQFKEARADRGWATRVVVAPADVGMIVDPVQRSMRCSCCDQFYPWDAQMHYEMYGEAEQIFYVCPECQVTLSPDQKSSIFRSRQAPLVRLIKDRR